MCSSDLVANAANTLDLTWNTPTFTGGSGITEYWIQLVANGVTSTKKTGSDTTSFTITGLTANQSYSITIAAYTSSLGLYTTTPVIATPYGLPAAPSNLAASRANQQSVISFTKVTDTATVSGYTVELTTDGVLWTPIAASPLPQITSGSVVSTTITGLNNGQPYVVRVATVSRAGVSSYSSQTFTPAGLPGVPTSIAGTPSDRKSTRLNSSH